MSIENVSLTLVANQPQEFYFNGEYFEILEAQYPLDVLLKDRNGVPMSTLRNAEASFFARPGHYGTIVLQSSQSQVVRFVYGSGDVGTRRISSTVAVIDGGKARSLANAAFADYVPVSAVASQYPYVQLWNPAGSGKRLVIEQVYAALVVQGISTGSIVTNAFTFVRNAAPKLAGGANSVAELRAQTAVALYGGPGSLTYAILPNVSSQVTKLTEPIVVLPGFGFVCRGNAGGDLTGGFEWFEEAI